MTNPRVQRDESEQERGDNWFREPDHGTNRHCLGCHTTTVMTTGTYFGNACGICGCPWEGPRPITTRIGTVQPASTCSICDKAPAPPEPSDRERVWAALRQAALEAGHELQSGHLARGCPVCVVLHGGDYASISRDVKAMSEGDPPSERLLQARIALAAPPDTTEPERCGAVSGRWGCSRPRHHAGNCYFNRRLSARAEPEAPDVATTDSSREQESPVEPASPSSSSEGE